MIKEERHIFRSIISVILVVTMLTGIFPVSAFAQGEVFGDRVNTDFKQDVDENQWEEIERNTEIILRNPSLYTKIDGIDILGAEVSHNQTSRTYLLEDGTYLTRYFDEPIMYEDENGNLVDIDNSLKFKGNEYVNTENAYSVSLPKQGEGITIENKGYTMQLIPLFGELKNAVVTDNAIRYNSIADGVDLQYTVNGSNIKEDIIINKPIENTVFKYEIVCDGLQFNMDNGVLYAYESGNAEPIFTFSAPYMSDNSGAISEAVNMEVAEENGKMILTVFPDSVWINSEERAYPIVVDPVIELTKSNLEWGFIENGVGTNAYPAGPDRSHYSNPYLYVGYEGGNLTGYSQYGLYYGQTRSYIKINYDFSSIPDGTIVSAKLKAYKYAGSPESGTKVFCKLITSDWTDTKKTWNTQPKNLSTIGVGADVSGDDKWVEWDISTAVIEWKNGRANYGLMLVPEYEDQTGVCFSGPGNEEDGHAMYFDISWTVPNAVDENMALDTPVINLRALTKTDASGIQELTGVFADGVVRPTLKVDYRLNDVDSGTYESAEYGRQYPDSDTFKSEAEFTLGYKDLYESNWQSKLFKNFQNNVLYNVYAIASNDTESTPEGKSDDFIVYQFTEQDTLPYIANFYGVSLEQIILDNRPQDYLGFTGNTFFIRNPKQNATTPYTRPDDMTDDHKRDLIYANMGRGMHSEFDLEPINVNIGNYYFGSTDAESSEYNGIFELTRTYNSIGSKSTGVFGYGWSFEYAQKLTGRADGSITYTMGDGKQIVFTKNSDGTYKTPAGYYMTLEKVDSTKAAERYYSITNSDGTVYKFDCYGLLQNITDINGFATTVNYDSNYKLSGITTASGRNYVFTTNSSGQITTVTLPNGGILVYEYKDGNLVKFTNADGDVVMYEYNAQGQMSAWYDGNGNRVIKNEYDTDGRITKQTDAKGNVSTLSYSEGKTVVTEPDGSKTTYTYDEYYRTLSVSGDKTKTASYNAENELVSVVEDGSKVSYEYDDNGNITLEKRADGTYREVTYDKYGNALTIRDFDGSITENEYDSKGNVIKTTRPDGTTNETTYDEFGQVTSLVDGNGNKTTFTYYGLTKMVMTDANGNNTTCVYDAMGRLISETDSEGKETKTIYSKNGKVLGVWKTGDIYEQYLYDGNGNCIEVIDPEGYKCTFTYDETNKMIAASNPLGGVITYSYDENGNKVAETDSLGNTTRYSYDNANRLIKTMDATGRVKTNSYDKYGRIINVTDFDGTTIEYEYDEILGLPLKITDKTGVTSYTYDALGQQTKVTYPDGSEILTEYDSVGNIVKLTAKNGLVTEYTYDGEGNVLSQKDNMGATTTYVYDAVGNLIKTTNALGFVTTYEYNGFAQLTGVTDANGGVTKIAYDITGNISKFTNPDGTSESFVYDKNGNLTKETDANGNVTTYKYDGAGDLVAKIDALGNTESYAYNTAQNLVSYTNQTNDTTVYEYNSLYQVERTTDPDGYTTKLVYNEQGNIAEVIAANDGKTEYSYDSAGYLVKASTADGLITEYKNDIYGRVISETDNAGNTEETTYDSLGNILTKTDSLGRVAEYSYDLYGNVTSIKDFNGDVTKYEYDLLSRLVSVTEPNGLVTTYEYDALGNLISEIRPENAKYTYKYDVLSRLIEEINPLSETTKYEYDNVGNIISQTNALGNTTEYAYSKTNNLVSVTAPNGAVSEYAYDAAGRVQSTTTAEGNITEYLYDGRGNVVKEKNALGYVTEYEYDSMSNLVSVKTPLGSKTEYEYNYAGLNTRITDAEGYETVSTYSVDGKLETLTEANGLVYSYLYDKLSRITKISDSMGAETVMSYDERGNLSTQCDEDGNEYTYAYDEFDRMTSMVAPNGATTEYTYDILGNLKTMTTPSGAVTDYSYDILSRVTEVNQLLMAPITYTYDALGQITGMTQGEKNVSAVYDSVGNVVSVTNPLGDSEYSEYDMDGRLIVSTDYNGNSEEYGYDSIGNIVNFTDKNGYTTAYTYNADSYITAVKDALGNTTEYKYDKVGNLTKVRTASNKVTSYSYDGMGNLVSKTDASGEETRYAYNLHNDLVKVTSPDGTVEEFVYNLSSQIEKSIKPDGKTIEYSYDSLNNLLSKDYSDDETDVTLGYDVSGNRVTMSDESGKTTYTYDELSRITSVTNGFGKKTTYSYDKYGRIDKVVYPEGRKVSYTYDLADNLISVKDSAGETTNYTYDKNGNVLSCTRSSGIVTEYKYDAMGQVVALVNKDNGTVISSFNYTYDGNGQIVEEIAVQDETKSHKTFTYDEDNQLSGYTETVNGKTSTTTYSYSPIGSRVATTVSEDGEKISYLYDDEGRLISEAGGENGTVHYSYDDNGNLIEKKTSDSVTTYTYDIENRLTAVREGGALLMAASYDGDGNRVFQVTRQMSDAAQWNVSEDEGKGAGRDGDSDTPNDKFPGSSIIHSFYEKIFGDPENTIFWYGFGQGMLQSTSVANASLAAVLSDWFCNFWNMVTGEYDLVLRSEVDYSDEDIDFMEYAGLSDKDIEDITSTQIVIPENSDEAKQIDYELTYYVNDINTANTQVLMTYGRNDTEKDVYTYGVDRIVHDDLQRDKASDYVYDGRGSVVQTVVDGEIDLSITYDPYGDITDGVDENFVGYAYNGEESNEVTGLQYLRARYYNTEIGSFISIDSYLGSITEPISQNRYTYANNNPVNNIDPTGHYSQGIDKYYQSTGLNELRDQMTAAAFHAGEVEAQNAFNRQVARAQNTSMFNYNRISGISQDTANAYIANGIIKAAETSMNYGCETPTLSAEAVATYVVTVQNAKTTANQKISNIKRNKQAQYRAYMEYQRELQRQREAAAEQERIRRNLQKMMAVVSSGLAGVTKTLETLNGVRTSNGGPVETSRTDDFIDTIDCVPDLFGDVWGALGDLGEAAVEVVTILPGEVYQAALDVHQVTVDQAETFDWFHEKLGDGGKIPALGIIYSGVDGFLYVLEWDWHNAIKSFGGIYIGEKESKLIEKLMKQYFGQTWQDYVYDFLDYITTPRKEFFY